ncbi:MAG: GTP cyclohydrolase I FolE [Alphaproteobacteria bacterium]
MTQKTHGGQSSSVLECTADSSLSQEEPAVDANNKRTLSEVASSDAALAELPTREEAEAAVRTLIRYAGDDPTREGLRDTPRRVVDAYAEFFSGYHQDPVEILSRTFDEVHGYDDLVMVRDIRLESHCEHHMVPIIGVVHVAYLPRDRVVGISKLARVVEIFGKRLVTQETMTAQIAEAIENALKPRGVAILIDALHQCMTTRGVHKPDASTVTTRFTGVFADDADYRDRFLRMIHSPRIMKA